jgi:lactate 2-monooxygenase
MNQNDRDTPPSHEPHGPARQRSIYLDGVSGRRPLVPVDTRDLERAAARVMSPQALAYVAGGAGRGQTMQANEAAFGRHQLLPYMLRDAEQRDISVNVLGKRWSSPFFACPIGVLEMVHPHGDREVARAATDCDVPLILSNQASAPMEEVTAAMGKGRRWFQLYWSRSNELVASLLARAEASGCEAVVVTLDTTLLGWRTRDLDLGWLPFLRGMGIAQYTSDPVFLRLLRERAYEDAGPAPARRLNAAAIRVFLQQLRRFPGGWQAGLSEQQAMRAVQLFIRIYSRPSLNWDELGFLRQCTRLPILLKGIQRADDARRALDAGVDGLMVSNHGGRQVDGAIGALDALPDVVQAVQGRIPVLLDSGVRSGADAVKALCLGADAVGIGRPYVYALALAGQAGVQELFEHFKAEFDLTMGLCGCRNRSELNADLLAKTAG